MGGASLDVEGVFPVPQRDPFSGEIPRFSFLHLSDFHFVGELTERGRRLLAKRLVKSHAFAKIDALALTVNNLRRVMRQVDLIVLTGDISTDGTTESLKTALSFIEKEKVYKDGRLITEGLWATPDKRIVLPGNHDRYSNGLLPFQIGSKNLETVLKGPQQYPYVVGFPGRDSRQEAAVLFFVFDSTLPDWTDVPILSRIAQGTVHRAECTWLEDQAREITSKGTVKGVTGESLKCRYDNAVRVVLIHHHPIRVRKGNHDFTKLRNDKRFVDACFGARVNLVLFGHEHVEYYAARARSDPPSQQHTVHFVCCPSTSEYTSEPSGFYLFDLYERGFSVDRYHWTRDSVVFSQLERSSATWGGRPFGAHA